MYIGKVSKLTGASPKTIRVYEKLEIIPIIKRIGTYSVFEDNEVDLIRIIKQSQKLGFKLQEIKELFINEKGLCNNFS